MDFSYSARTNDLLAKLNRFYEEHVYPNEAEWSRQVDTGDRWKVLPLVESLKGKARGEGLWNLFLPESRHGAGLSNLEYAPLCEVMGRVSWSNDIYNTSEPLSGNNNVLDRY